MNDKSKIIAGLAIFVLIITFPFWSNLGRRVPAPKLELTEKAKGSKQCVLSNESMVSEHMMLLDLWRHSVVRGSARIYTNNLGKEYEMSLSNTCLDCHSNKVDFCDKCHEYVSVKPYCWDCHVENPEGEE